MIFFILQGEMSIGFYAGHFAKRIFDVSWLFYN